jgi:hypothetical protein
MHGRTAPGFSEYRANQRLQYDKCLKGTNNSKFVNTVLMPFGQSKWKRGRLSEFSFQKGLIYGIWFRGFHCVGDAFDRTLALLRPWHWQSLQTL